MAASRAVPGDGPDRPDAPTDDPTAATRHRRWRRPAPRRRTWSRLRRFQRRVEIPMLVASLLFIPLLVVPWLVDLPTGAARAMAVGDWLIWLVFVAEYVTLLYLAPDRWRVARTHVFDLIIIVVPFARPLRKLRVLRMLRLGAVAGRVAQLVKQLTARSGFKWFLAFVALVMVLGGMLVYAFERTAVDPTITSWEDGVWWALVTTTTVGYGDEYPTTTEGRAIAAGLMLLGISLISVITARIAAFFVATEEEGLDDINLRLDRIERLLDGAGTGTSGGEDDGRHSPRHIEERYQQLTPAQRRELDEVLDRMLDDRRHAERRAQRQADHGDGPAPADPGRPAPAGTPAGPEQPGPT